MRNLRALALVAALALTSPTVWAAGFNNYDCFQNGLMQPQITTGNLNISCGSDSLIRLNTGSNNLAFGNRLARLLQTGSNNIFLGNEGEVPAINTSNLLWIGPSRTITAITSNMVATGVSGILGDARVTADVPATTTTFANVTDLSRTLEAGFTYSFRAVLFYDANATGGHKYTMAGTATATSIIYHVESGCDASNLDVITTRLTALAGAGAGQAGCVAGKTVIEGTITVATAGTLVPQFAQNAANGTSTIKAGSTISVRRVM